MARRKQPQEDFECPVCGADVPAGSKSCPECGACEKSGWSGDDGLDNDEFDYDKFVAEEFGKGAPKKGAQRWWAIVALILFLALALSMFFGWWRQAKKLHRGTQGETIDEYSIGVGVG